MGNSFSLSLNPILGCALLIAFLSLNGCANRYNECVQKVTDPNTVVWFAITENNKTEEFCECIEKTGDWKGGCFKEALRDVQK